MAPVWRGYGAAADVRVSMAIEFRALTATRTAR
jgi:hypothetical protein